MEKRTSVTLDYLDMEPALQLSKSKPDILKKLADELVSSDSVESRIYGYKNSHGETTSIFISDFINLDNAFFCTLMDMEEGAAANIPQKLLQSKKFSLEDTSVSKKNEFWIYAPFSKRLKWKDLIRKRYCPLKLYSRLRISQKRRGGE